MINELDVLAAASGLIPRRYETSNSRREIAGPLAEPSSINLPSSLPYQIRRLSAPTSIAPLDEYRTMTLPSIPNPSNVALLEQQSRYLSAFNSSAAPRPHPLLQAQAQAPSQALEEELILASARRIRAERLLNLTLSQQGLYRGVGHPSNDFRLARPSVPVALPRRVEAYAPSMRDIMHSASVNAAIECDRSEELARATHARILATARENQMKSSHDFAASSVATRRHTVNDFTRIGGMRAAADAPALHVDAPFSDTHNPESLEDLMAARKYYARDDTQLLQEDPVELLREEEVNAAIPQISHSENISTTEVVSGDEVEVETDQDNESEFPKNLALPTDDSILNEIHCFLRTECLDLFLSTEIDLLGVGKGARPSTVGQVGLRCVFCADVPRDCHTRQSVCFPSKIENIFEGMRNFQRVHLHSCPYIPQKNKDRHVAMKARCEPHKVSLNLVKSYYIRSANEIGLKDSSMGIKYVGRPKGSCPLSELPLSMFIEPIDEPPKPVKDKSIELGKFEDVVTPETRQVLIEAKKESTPFVRTQDYPTVADFPFLLFHQLQAFKPTRATFSRRGMEYNPDHPVPGLCCKYCYRAEDCSSGCNKGMYFPQNTEALGDSSFSQTFLVHLMSCTNAPQSVKNAFDELHYLTKTHSVTTIRGSKKRFMEKIWKRMEQYCEKKSKKSTNASSP